MESPNQPASEHILSTEGQLMHSHRQKCKSDWRFEGVLSDGARGSRFNNEKNQLRYENEKSSYSTHSELRLRIGHDCNGQLDNGQHSECPVQTYWR